MNSVSCSPSDASLFAAGGGSSGTSKLAIFKYSNDGISTFKDFGIDQFVVLQTAYGQIDESLYYMTSKG